MNYRFYFKAWLQTFLALKALKTLEDLQEMVLLIRKSFSKNLKLSKIFFRFAAIFRAATYRRTTRNRRKFNKPHEKNA